MHSIHIARRFFPSVGGVETHVLRIALELIALGHTVTVVTLQPDKDKRKTEILHRGIRVLYIDAVTDVEKMPIWRVIWRMREEFARADVVQAHDVAWWLLPIYHLVYKKLHTTFHGFEGVYPVRFFAKVHRLFVSFASKTSLHVGAFIQEFYFDKPSKITYGGAHIPPEYVVGKLQKKSNTKKINIAFVGRLEPDTGVNEYCAVLEGLDARGISFEMSWVGDGSLRATCQRWGLVTGMVTDVLERIVPADIVFASSYLSILEAQALGKVVCCIYANPLKKAYLQTYIGKKHLLLSGNAEKMAGKIQKLLTSPAQFSELQKNAHEFAKTQTWQKVANTYLKLWDKRS